MVSPRFDGSAEMDTIRRRSNLEHYDHDGDAFLRRVIVVDETVTRSFEPQLKRPSNEWHYAKRKVIILLKLLKVMAILV